LTAASIAAEAGVDDFVAEINPEAKLKLIRSIQAEGKLVAMTGDGTNDAPALAQADVAVVMNSGTQAAKEAGNMVDLDSDPTKLIEIVGIGKQLLMTRGALTTFSIANDVAKYFAILPAAFAVAYPSLDSLNIMKLDSPFSAILSAILLITTVVYPLAVTGVGQALFHDQANGSFVSVNGQDVGSSLVGQSFSKPEYFHPRPSAAGAGYDPSNSSGSNLGPTSDKLINGI